MADEQTVDLASIDFPVEDPSTLPTSREVPLGKLEFEIRDFSAYHTKPKNDAESIAKGNFGNKLAIKATFAVTAPEEFKGYPYSHDFYIGSNDDPEAKKESTWRSNATLLMSLLKESGVQLSGIRKPVEALMAAKGSRVGGEVKLDPAKPYNDKVSGETKMGREKHIVRKWFRAGSQPYTAIDGPHAEGPMAPPPAPSGLSSSD